MSFPNELRKAREAFLSKLKSEDAAVPGEQAAVPTEEAAQPDLAAGGVTESNAVSTEEAAQPIVAAGATQGNAVPSEPESPGPAQVANGSTTAGGMTLTFNFNISGASPTFLPQFFGQFMNPRAVCGMLPGPAKEMNQTVKVTEIEPPQVMEVKSAGNQEIESARDEATEPACVVVEEAFEPEATEPAVPLEVVDLCRSRSPSPDFSFLQDFSDNDEAVDDPDEDDFLPSRNIRLPSPPLLPRPKRSLSLSGRTRDGKRPMLSNQRFSDSSQPSTRIPVNNLAQAKALAASASLSSVSNFTQRSSESATSSTEQDHFLARARAAIASSSGSAACSSTKTNNLTQARTAMASASSGSASGRRPLNVSRARAATVAMAQWRPNAAPVRPAVEAATVSVEAAAPIEAAASIEAAALDEAAGFAAPAPGAPNNPEPHHRPGICTVCMEREVEAMLRCKHLFCIRCLEALKVRKLPCPKCRAAFRKWDRVYL